MLPIMLVLIRPYLSLPPLRGHRKLCVYKHLSLSDFNSQRLNVKEFVTNLR